ncbi:hypothetical protein TPHA_0F03600 [Tetrapisispora phaffii CBS 4417]|uniref:Phosphatidyl-N-methylethanolamine N-methyltransferase n=1 Tax=Tetrapisispora phaffii (strain ATCC 24235 / CBS 4417 / NBRC 1672 / NRRL Y-8282 / UCD 70-5) TaxID=1071381 RepID=G8BUQ4_TETPH|nr:hypothetical protein TPHA_0F03600 [Tetrapisispora phaffii CBS 4417]CCE63840.1 hypothetical protein TPHA_0F03600 [Tetrapisispora phaffii CBS 4417]
MSSVTNSAVSAVSSAITSAAKNTETINSLSSAFDYILDIYLDLFESINFDDQNLKISLLLVAFNPIFWNLVARLEFSTHFLTKLAGNAKRGCYILAFTIFSLGIARDYFFEQALKNQFTSPYLEHTYVKIAGVVSFLIGQVLVISSMYQLGITGTYLGDYFGILMDERVVSFPFNVSNNPMYQGSTLSFLGTSLVYGKAAGLLVTFTVYTMYSCALKLEEPFTSHIYALRDEGKTKKNN